MTPRNPDSRCNVQAKNGKPCWAAATAGGLCFLHANPNKASELGRIGGRSNRHSAAEGASPGKSRPRLDCGCEGTEDRTSRSGDSQGERRERKVAHARPSHTGRSGTPFGFPAELMFIFTGLVREKTCPLEWVGASQADFEVGLRRTSGTVDSPLPPIAISTCPCPAMRNEAPMRNEPNKPLVFSLLVHKGVRGKWRGEVWRKFANCFSGAGFTSTREKDPDTPIVL
jgi:hypothetical protein